ncbi:MAG: glycosyltransferase [Raineya sp.]
MNLAPIILFVYNRPWHTEQTLKALEKNFFAQNSILYIYADGIRENSTPEQIEKVHQVRKIIRQEWNFKEIHIIEREKNWGLAENVIDGITTVVNQYGKIIVLEDDLVTSPYFLDYCNQGLELYQKSCNVYAINAFQFNLGVDEFETFLCPLATSSWGWATWADKWAVFEKNPQHKNLIQQHQHLRKRFNFADYDYASMLDNPKSWAIRWYYSVFLRNGLGVFPTKSLVKNIGFDGSGENCGVDLIEINIFKNKPEFSISEEINIEYYVELLKFFTVKQSNTNKSVWDRLKRIIK